ncbi:G-D-S-L family lipolytic protein [Flavobacterium sp. NST-5]|uniref:G-D-S-L family lipolytic protein n=1 Tax=Flavobacterium ichthyis TaxID=2698827 RepID=A0ABW9Z5H8_9FLAO|nr:G-D-S-L family lipolytic protein [Flavobacterium ichthyis]NBL63939.1 G-D-S-L family lipolytic protein [Flavobacterium ichthyis]
MNKNFKWLYLVPLVLTACSSDDSETSIEEPVVIVSGEADFSKYIALGNSLTAGYSDNALYKRGQEQSYPKLLAEQFALAGGGEFSVPYTNDNTGGLLLGGNLIAQPRLFFNGSGPASLPGTPTTDITNPVSGPVNNMGIPGAKLYHLVAPGYGSVAGVAAGTANPYYVRFASSASASVIQDAVAQNATFFTLWIGNNDILTYASSGGVGIDQTGNTNPATYANNDITDPGVFANVYNQLLQALTANGAKGVVANIPDITTIPFFTFIKYNQLTQANLTIGGANQVAALNTQLYGPLKQALTAFGSGDRIELLSATGNNPMLMVDKTLPNLSAQLTAALTMAGYPPSQAAFLGSVYGQARQTRPTDYILLSSSTEIGQNQTGVPTPFNIKGITYPLQDHNILIPSEVAMIQNAANQYNATIESLATQYNLAFVDAKAILSQVNTTGIPYEGYTLKSEFIFGGAFSLDGVHPTGRGYALLANKFIEAINTKYGSNLPLKKISNYDILRSPQLP